MDMREPWFCTADEIAYAVIIASRLLDDPDEEGKDPEWIVTRRDRAIKSGGVCGSSRAALYAFDALVKLRPRARHRDIAKALGYLSYEAVWSNLVVKKRARHGNWDQTLADEICRKIEARISVLSPDQMQPQLPRQPGGYTHGLRHAPVDKTAKNSAPVAERPAPAEMPASIAEQTEVITTKVAAPAAAPIRRPSFSDVPIPAPRHVSGVRRPLTAREASVNAGLMGDPPRDRSALAQRERGES